MRRRIRRWALAVLLGLAGPAFADKPAEGPQKPDELAKCKADLALAREAVGNIGETFMRLGFNVKDAAKAKDFPANLAGDGGQ